MSWVIAHAISAVKSETPQLTGTAQTTESVSRTCPIGHALDI